MPTSTEIRQQFIDFFCQKHGHTFVPSSSVVPLDDPTLLFANAGMNQFKPYFLGTEKPPYKRAANTQKCIRAGGKHNDLDDVGKDTYHHTFFEMLGNWSFGDYFKKEAIAWAWELLTDVWKMDKSRLHVTVFEGDPANGIPRDDEAADYWRAVGVPDAHIHLGNKKDNFWEMGNTGPCGPCTEIHYDHTPDKSGGPLVNKGTDQVIEIWNNVFIQFNRNADQSLTPLPAKHVDTGMGFERVTKVLQGKSSNYDTDVFTPIFEAIQSVTGAPAYTGKLEDLKDTAYRVIADHIRMLTFALTDGGVPSNVGRGYVIRSVLRRAERYGWQQFGLKEPFLYKLVPTVVEHMGAAFPELKRDPKKVQDVIRDEEKSFLRTLGRGIKLFAEAADRARKNNGVVSGKDAFDLHTTHGLFIDITTQMALEAGLTVDRADYERRWVIFTTPTNNARPVVSAIKGDLPKTDDSPKYQPTPIDATVVGWVKDNTVTREGTLAAGEAVALLLDRTNFYAEQGGQVGDAGMIRSPSGADFVIEDTLRLGDAVLHIGRLEQGELAVGEKVQAEVGATRPDTMKNHTATHLMNLALREVLGGHVEQKGSLVDADKTRFDFSHDRPLTPDEIRAVEARVNQAVAADQPVAAITMPLAEAKKLPGVRAVFGEKYPDPVRVVMVGAETPADVTADLSVEFCGGTHVPRTGTIGYFKIVEQGGVAKGVRRVTAVTGRAATETVRKMTAVVDDLTARFQCKVDDLPARVDALQEEIKKLQAQLKKGVAADLSGTVDKLVDAAPEVNGVKLVVGQLPAAPVDQVRTQVDRVRQKVKSAFVVFGWAEDDGKAPLIVALTSDLLAKGLKAGDVIKPLAEIVGGKGGGKPDLAQAGGKDASKLPEAMAKALELGRELLTK
ncbi:alanine--tRNA ligase [Fimbriiglobus ruber]|uniref:Alanine--tRNA ligase n=1 Tax=Fimbriiglobus ruber TaxID=1908690 RepID=A0A225D985_9BACT|nr:alanine--tRNA ligase [Fimbriiglobus ruber]OWK37533.1 Alanyl-tRNA synthetase [Fimbriiglobus ruber]